MDALNEAQKRAFDAILAGHSIFVTGPGGTGKSHLLRTLYAAYKGRTGKVLAVTALTGCAALLLGPWAKTLHSWAGIGLGRGSVDSVARSIVCNGRKKKLWRSTSCLVIDEVSMLTPHLLEYLDKIGRIVRKCPGAPFGGLQLVFVGDFYQLPPVTKDVALAPGEVDRTFAFESPLWSQIVQFTVNLTEIKRQADPVFQRILNEARIGDLSPESYEALEARKTMDWKRQEIKPTLLFTRNADVSAINDNQMRKLDGEPRIFKAKYKIPPKMPQNIADFLKERLDRDAPYEVELALKERAQVMLLVNMDPKAGLVNGSRGMITGFHELDGAPLVKFLNGPTAPVKIEAASWATDGEEQDEIITCEQIPLRVAYSFTIHKAQGSSIDSALVDVGPSTFEYGQAYVALSRVRSLGALYVYEIHPKAFKAHPAVKAFYAAEEEKERVRQAALEAARALEPGAAADEPVAPMVRQFTVTNAPPHLEVVHSEDPPSS
jgi:ATP-dependent DNA helicase PIF1